MFAQTSSIRNPTVNPTHQRIGAFHCRTMSLILSVIEAYVCPGASTGIDVSASTAITDPSRTDLGSTLDTNATQNLPLVSRNPYNFILFQPNVSGRANTEFGVPRRVNANGFNGRINYQLDGSNNTESDRAGIRLIPISNSYVQEAAGKQRLRP